MWHRYLASSFVRFSPKCCLCGPKRNYSKTYRETQEEKKRPRVKALSQLDDFYGSVFQNEWPSIRIALLSNEKTGIVINNYSDKERVINKVKNLGAYNVRDRWNMYGSADVKNEDDEGIEEYIYQIDGNIEKTILKHQRADLEEIFPEPLDSALTHTQTLSQSLSTKVLADDSDDESAKKPMDLTKDQPLTESLRTADYDTSRIIAPGSTGLNLAASLYDFVPATRLKGLDDYIPSSAHFAYYKDSSETPIEFALESEVSFPELLDVFAFERGNCDTFDKSSKGSTEVLDYHIMKLGSLAPVLALDLKRGENVLDLTAVSRDIVVLVSQTLIPDLFVVNCGDSKQGKYYLRFLDSYIYNVCDVKSNIIVTDSHPLEVNDGGKFDKIIVSVPSTEDRKAVMEDEENMFSPLYVKTRIKLPEMQSLYLRKALELVKEGGVVIYFTETLSPIQNDAVVQKVLDDLYINAGLEFTVMDLSAALKPLQPFMKVTKTRRFGHLVVPFLPNNCGPLYFSKIVKRHKKEGSAVTVGEKLII